MEGVTGSIPVAPTKNNKLRRVKVRTGKRLARELGVLSPEVLARYRPALESPKAAATELGITTAEVLARARGTDLTLHAITHGGAVWIYRPARAAVLRSATPK